MRQQTLYKIIGMQKDVADSGMDKQHAFDIRNMKFRNSDTNTVTALVNEAGNILARDKSGNPASVRGTVIGFNTLNDTGIIFTHEESSKEYIDVKEQQEQQTEQPKQLSARSTSQLRLGCSYSVVAGGTVSEYQSTCNLNMFDDEPFDIYVSINGFSGIEMDEFAGLDDNEEVLIIVPGPASHNLQLFKDDVEVSELVLTYGDIRKVAVKGDSYDFRVRINVTQTDVVQTLNNSVMCYYKDTYPDHPQELFGINIYTVVPAAGSDDDEPVDPTPEYSDDVICDYKEETNLAQCDHIYLITVNDNGTLNVFEYFRGCLNFDVKHPIESTVYFENEKIQKVYWVDGINPLRYANIADKNGDNPWTSNIMFESVPFLHLQEDVTVTRNSTGGVFPSCTVQWCFTYLNRYGAESNIAWISPIHYSSPDNRGGAPGENCSNSFTIRINKYEQDGRFDYIRLYHIIHTSRDQEVGVRRIADIPIPTERVEVEIDGQTEMRFPTIVFTDTNTTGETVDPNELLYLGKNYSIIPNTIEQKSNTMFLGNLTQQFKWLRDLNLGITPGAVDTDDIEFDNVASADSVVPADVHSGYYSHENQLKYSSSQITTFQRGEDYRLGFQAQDKTGRWSDVIWLNDVRNTTKSPKYSNGKLCPVHAKYTLLSATVTALRDAGYRKVRPVVVYPKPWERNIFTGGLLNPTVYNVKDRAGNAPFAQSSWFLRPFSPINLRDLATNGDYNGMPYPESQDYLAHATDDEYNHEGDHWWSDMPYLAIDSFIYEIDHHPQAGRFDYVNKGSWAEFRHDYQLGDSQQHNGEVQSMYSERAAGLGENEDHIWNSAVYSYITPYPVGELRDFINRWSDFFYVDQSILTMNSADIEFDEVLQATSMEDCELKITGIIPMSSFIASYDIMTNTPPNKFFHENNDSMMIPQGLYSSEIIGATMTESGFGWKSLINGAYWHDDLAYCTIEDDNDNKKKYKNEEVTPIGFAVYPWHGSGSLNNDSVGSRKVYPSDDGTADKNNRESKSTTGDNYISAELKTKILSNMHYSYDTFGTSSLDACMSISAKVSTVLDEQRVSLTNIKEPEHSGLGTVHYFGSVDKLITPINDSFIVTEEDGYQERPLTRRGGYPRMASYLPYYEHGFDSDSTNHLAFYAPYSPIGWRNTLTGYNGTSDCDWLKQGADKSMSSISIKYKSCNHIVIALDYIKNNTNNKYYQPYFDWNVQDTEFSLEGFTNPPFWTPQSGESVFNNVAIKLYDGDPFGVFDSYGDSYSFAKFGPDDKDKAGFLYYGQLFRKTVPENKFGGNTDEALEQNMWLPAGDAVYLTGDVTLEWSVGDTYYQRYDALRTYPFTEEDKNKVVDIMSFMTETHINIDGRYDKNRGLSNNNHCRPTNFNLMNYVYSQQDNFFVYHAMNPKKIHLDVLEYSFTWTLPKVSGALRDEWTRTTLASSHDCDGNKGPLNRIVRLDNSLVAFQSAGVAQILFNENVQIQASEGLPIELANSGKLQGLRYYTTEAGCQNKWSIAVAPNGIYWIDGRSKEFYMLSEAIAPLSTSKLMSTWFKNNADVGKLWNPGDWTGFFTHQDITTGELFLTSGNTALCYDTTTGEFSSFYDYQNTDAMFTIGGVVITAAKDRRFKVQSNVVLNDNLWLHRKSDVHCYFYNKQYPCSVEVVCNSSNQGNDYGTDKVFDNLEWRADAWELGENGWDYKPFVTFDKLSGSTNYQKFSTDLNAVNNNAPDDSVPQLSYPKKPVNLRKKFKIWHTTIPRAEGTKRDRIRDTWCHIKLELSTDLSEYRHILHDIIVTYFI